MGAATDCADLLAQRWLRRPNEMLASPREVLQGVRETLQSVIEKRIGAREEKTSVPRELAAALESLERPARSEKSAPPRLEARTEELECADPGAESVARKPERVRGMPKCATVLLESRPLRSSARIHRRKQGFHDHVFVPVSFDGSRSPPPARLTTRVVPWLNVKRSSLAADIRFEKRLFSEE